MFLMDAGAEGILNILHSNGYSGYVVGGCVRDMLLDLTPKDWDITTNAVPDMVKGLFPKTADTGLKHGTVTVFLNEQNYEVTTYRLDSEYTDKRRPDNVTFTFSLKDDLSRRDFTINALAYNCKEGVIDYFNGQEDLKRRRLRTVGKPDERFAEDALRMLRAIRLACTYDLSIEESTYYALKKNSELIRHISQERIRDELNRILISAVPSKGINLLKDTGILYYILPEAERMIGFGQQNPHHHLDVFQHTLIVLDEVSDKMILRWAALLHDIAKPVTFSTDEQGCGHFYGHNLYGEKIAEQVLRRLRFDNETVNRVCLLVREHMSRYAELGRTGVKRLINRVGVDNLEHLFQLQIADIKGSAPPHDFTKVLSLQAQVQEILWDKEPLTVKDLAINGTDLMAVGINPGKKMGQVLSYLLERVLEDPELNNKEKLLEMVKSLY